MRAVLIIVHKTPQSLTHVSRPFTSRENLMICKCVCVTEFNSGWWFYILTWAEGHISSVSWFPVIFCSVFSLIDLLSLSLLVPGNLGCFKDSGDPTPLSGSHQTSTKLTIQNCISFCRNQRYKVRIKGYTVNSIFNRVLIWSDFLLVIIIVCYYQCYGTLI